MKLYQIEQGSAEYYAKRLGIPTASNFARIITPEGEPSKQARAYMYKLIAEQILREPTDDQLGYVAWVDHGKAHEPNAVATMQFHLERKLLPGGFVTSDDGRIGCSPDRLFPGYEEAVEVKCPAPWTLIGYHLDGLGNAYRPQVQGQLLVGGFKAVHFWAWHPQCPPYHNVTRPDLAYQAKLTSLLDQFCDRLAANTERARAIGAYAISQRVETPGEIAYQDAGDEQLKIVIPD